jgi:hypothetical protein
MLSLQGSAGLRHLDEKSSRSHSKMGTPVVFRKASVSSCSSSFGVCFAVAGVQKGVFGGKYPSSHDFVGDPAGRDVGILSWISG